MERLSKILVDVDASATAQPALECAAALARRSGARLHLVHVLSPAGAGDAALRPEMTQELVALRRNQLAALAFRAADVVADIEVLVGLPADALIRDVGRFNYDLVVRAHPRDLAARRIAGIDRVDADLFRRCPCPVWTVGSSSLPAFPRIAAAIDVRQPGTASRSPDHTVLEAAFTLASLFDAPLSLVHAWRPFSDGRVAQHAAADDYASYASEARRHAEHALRAVIAARPDDWPRLKPRLDLRQGDPVDVIPAFVVSEGIDLLVVGTPRRTGLGWQLRSRTAERLLDRVACSVLAIKPPAAVYEAGLRPAVSQ
jgi:nucleotide-binding universal stress UspA family protein